MALRHDDALGQLHLAGRPNQLTGAGALHIAAFADGGVDAQGAGVGGGDLHLIRLAGGAENGHVGHFLLGADDGQALVAGVLAGIGQGLADGQLIALAEQLLHRLLGQMDVTGGSLDHETHSKHSFVFCHNIYDSPPGKPSFSDARRSSVTLPM